MQERMCWDANVLPAPPLPLDKAIRTDALFHGQHDVPPPLNYKKAKEGRREEGKQDRGGGGVLGARWQNFRYPAALY